MDKDLHLAVVGSRSFENYKFLENTLNKENIFKIISGGARGADSLAEKYAKLNSIPIEIIKPNWNKYGRRAGVIRNASIVKNANHVIAFWDGTSRGTLSTINLCMKKYIPIKIIIYGDDIGFQNIF